MEKHSVVYTENEALQRFYEAWLKIGLRLAEFLPQIIDALVELAPMLDYDPAPDLGTDDDDSQ